MSLFSDASLPSVPSSLSQDGVDLDVLGLNNEQPTEKIFTRQGVPTLGAVRGRALIIGVDYCEGGVTMIREAQDTALQVFDTILEEGFAGEIKILVDDGDVEKLPTRANILKGVHWLSSGTRPNDNVLLFYIGKTTHGGHKEHHGSGRIVPADFRENGTLRFHDVVHSVSTAIHSQCTFFVVLDSHLQGFPAGRLSNQLLAYPEGDVRLGGGEGEPVLDDRINEDPSHPSEDVPLKPDPSKRVVFLSVGNQHTSNDVKEDSGRPKTAYITCNAFCTALQSLRRREESVKTDAILRAKKRVLHEIQRRFGDEAMGARFGETFTAYEMVPLSRLNTTQFMREADMVPAKRAGLVQNIVKKFFAGLPQVPLSEVAPPNLHDLIRTVRDLIYDTGGAASSIGTVADDMPPPKLDTTLPLSDVLRSPFLSCPSLWTTHGVFPEAALKRKHAKHIPSDSRAPALPQSTPFDIPVSSGKFRAKRGVFCFRVATGGGGPDHIVYPIQAGLIAAPTTMTLSAALERVQTSGETAFSFRIPNSDGGIQRENEPIFDTSTAVPMYFTTSSEASMPRGDDRPERSDWCTYISVSTLSASRSVVRGQELRDASIAAEMKHRHELGDAADVPEAERLQLPVEQQYTTRAKPFRIKEVDTEGQLQQSLARLFNFYQTHNPKKLPLTLATCKQFKGQDAALYAVLTRKYGAEPAATALPAYGWELMQSADGHLYYQHVDGRTSWTRPQPWRKARGEAPSKDIKLL